MDEKKLSIAMLGHKHMLSREGGIEIVVFNLSTRLAEKGQKVVCYDRSTKHVSGSTELDERREYKGVTIKPVWTLDKKGLAAMTSSFSAAWKAAWGEYDVVHIHAEGPAAMCGLVKCIWSVRGQRKKKRLVVTIHGLDWARAKWGGFATKYIKYGERQAVNKADEIIVLSRGVQEYFRSTYNRDTVFVPNGVSLPTPVDAKLITEKFGLIKDSYKAAISQLPGCSGKPDPGDCGK